MPRQFPSLPAGHVMEIYMNTATDSYFKSRTVGITNVRDYDGNRDKYFCYGEWTCLAGPENQIKFGGMNYAANT